MENNETKMNIQNPFSAIKINPFAIYTSPRRNIMFNNDSKLLQNKEVTKELEINNEKE